jgi:protein-L-isoaspartate(D-aspartate) O-methyltransferase
MTASRTLAALAAPYDRAPRWGPVPTELDAEIAADRELADAARHAREALCATLAHRLDDLPRSFLDAVLRVPRERFVLPADIAQSADDTPVPLDPAGNATVSAPHAYLLTYGLLGLEAGDRLVELGTGTGYGAALAREIVGPSGWVTTIEIDPALHERALRLLGAGPDGVAPSDGWRAGVHVLAGDARRIGAELIAARPIAARAPKVAVTYALTALPEPFERALPEGGRLVAPVGATEEQQELVRLERRGSVLWQTSHGAVRYVLERSAG